ncbi:hypothetical protein Kfla_0976 [Kribbella flavida DSM 17836]|uniref:Uncharacterized protein n=1 Tax=Kribbella flavida (strain DSM 17836 / JCM 10339 / NBRC 14399) TaxID=479435 RepID=D2Q193_KRIFD|nr:hypothetical protein [Kribbella flavida]ADB30081.1 hypothetical protein Kfla_0976 [Kribbella flavida DSM 17836]
MSGRRARPTWIRRNTAALASLALTVPLLGWWSVRADYKSWHDAEPRDPVTVAAGGTAYAGATWYAASVEVDPQPKTRVAPEPPPEGTTRVRVYLRLQVDDLGKLEGLGGCRVHLRAPDGRIWDESTSDGAFQDRPTGCTGGYDEKLQSWRGPKVARYYLKPQAGKPFETVAVFIVPSSVAGTVQPTITWATRLPQYLAFPR